MIQIRILKDYLLSNDIEGYIECFINGCQYTKTPITAYTLKRCIRKVNKIENKQTVEEYTNLCLDHFVYILSLTLELFSYSDVI